MTDSNDRVLHLGTARFDRDTDQLLDASGEQIALSYQTTRILVALIDQEGEAIDKDALISAAGGDATVTDEVLIASIGEIRKAIGDQAKTVIQTVPGVGFQLNTDAPGQTAGKGNTLNYVGLAVALSPIILILFGLFSGFLG